MRALPLIPDFSTLFPVTAIVLYLTSASMLHKTKIKTNPVGTPLATVAIKSEHWINEFE